MKILLPLLAVTGMACATEHSVTPKQLAAEALQHNPELRFYEQQIAALPNPSETQSPEIPQPLDFPSRENFRQALLRLDAGLSRLHLEEFRFVLEGTVRLKAMEYESASVIVGVADDLAARISALVRMLEERPAAGVGALIERRILEGAALPFLAQAAEARARRDVLRVELNGLTGRAPEAPLDVQGHWAFPGDPVSDTDASRTLTFKIREVEINRGLAGLDAASGIESFVVRGWFTREGLGAAEPVTGAMRPGTTAGASLAETRERLLADARAKIAREIPRRRAAVEATKELTAAIPPDLVENLRAASDLAERQYRVGALDVNLLIETHREFLEALRIRNEAILQAWRNRLDLEFLTLPAE